MKKVLTFIIVVLVLIVVVLGITTLVKKESEPKLEDLIKTTEEDNFSIEDYSIFGTHLNMSGCIDKKIAGDLSLVLKNLENEITIDSKFENKNGKTCFSISEKNNDGLYLDGLDTGEYILYVKDTIKGEEDRDESKYYTIDNKSIYDNFEYYTITRNNTNNKIEMTFNELTDKEFNKKYTKFTIKEEKLPDDIYDITLDAGHGGNDPGTNNTLDGVTYYEANYTLDIALALEKILEDAGLKVKMTRTTDVNLPFYDDGGRAVIPNEVKSKYSFSIHLNSSEGVMSYGGVEVYTPNDINYELATKIANSVATLVGYSLKPSDKILDGVYYTYFNENEIQKSKKDMESNGMKPYDIKVGAPEMYMIREVGGIHTKAYIDGRNEYYGLNKYYNSNQTPEPYLLELAYMNYPSDLQKLVSSREQFAEAIGNGIKEYLNIS